MSVIAVKMQQLGLSDADVASEMQVSREAVRLWRLGKRCPAINKISKLSALIQADPRAIRPDLHDLISIEPSKAA